MASKINLQAVSTDHYIGSGAWQAALGSPKVELYIDPTKIPLVGADSFTIGDLQKVSYATKKPMPQTGVDFYVNIYTQPYTGGDKSWYGNVLTLEPLYANQLNAPANTWNLWNTSAGTNQLTWFDGNHGPIGFYGAPTLANLQEGPITWADSKSIDYRAQKVKYIVLATGSGWSTTFTGLVDGLTIELKDGRVITLDLEDKAGTVWVDDSWASAAPGVEVLPGKYFGYNAFSTIQDGIDFVSLGGTVRVFPGNYSEKAANRLVNGTGPYQMGLFIPADQAGLSILGVDANDQLITEAQAAAASVTTNATNNFGPSGVFVEGDSVTISGLHLLQNISGDNKTVEVIGNSFTLRNTYIDVPGGGSVYLNDWHYDPAAKVSHIERYTIDGNLFGQGASLDIASGPGTSGAVAQRVILNNRFVMDGATWPGISFNGTVLWVGWFDNPVGGAVITGNHFSGGASQYIRARGDYDNSQFDWASYWNNNTFDKAVIAGPGLPGDIRAFSYPSGSNTFDNVRRIGATIQGELDHVQTGDAVWAKAGSYAENLTLSKRVQLIGAGSGNDPATSTILSSPAGSGQPLITLAASGLSNESPLLVQNMRLMPVSAHGLDVSSGSVQFVKLDHVQVIGTNQKNDTESEIGLFVSNTASLTDFVVAQSAFDHLTYGWYLTKQDDWGPNGSMVARVNVSGTSFSYNQGKGLYAEKLSDASFSDVLVKDNGLYLAYWNSKVNTGFDINLKGEEKYQNLVFNNLTVTGNAVGTQHGVGLAIKARDDGATYGLHKATLNGVTINGGTFSGNERGIRLGEPGKNNAGPSGVVITGVSFLNNLPQYSCAAPCANLPSASGAVVNETQSPVTAAGNYWGTLSWYGYGTVKGIKDQVSGSVSWEPWANATFTESLSKPTETFASLANAGKAEGASGASGGVFGYSAFATLQDAVNHAASGGQTQAAAGSYREQIVISKSLKLVGAGLASTTIQAPASLPAASDPASSIVRISGAGVNVELTGFTVSGPGPSGCGSIGAGIVVRDSAAANIHHNRITDVRDSSFSGCQNGVAIFVGRSAWSTNGSATIDNNQIDGFQKGGIVVSSTGSAATITNNTITGGGPTTVIAQNGIQVSSGASATISNNTLSGFSYKPSSTVSTAMLLYGGNADTSGNTISAAQVGIYAIGSSGTHTGNRIQLTYSGADSNALWGIVVDDPAPGHQPSPLDDGNSTQAPRGLAAAAASVQVVILTDNELVSDGTPEGVGIESDGGYGTQDIDLTIKNNILANWGTGVAVTQCAADCTASGFKQVVLVGNSITGGVTGLDNSASVVVDARLNWWGGAHGPKSTDLPKGDGLVVRGSLVADPWLCSGTDMQPEQVGFQPDTARCTNTATRLVFATQPSNGVATVALPAQPVVRAEGANGELAINFNEPVSLFMLNNPGGAILKGTTSRAAVNGSAAFSGLSLNQPGSGYTLLALSLPLGGTSQSFNILPFEADVQVAHGVVPAAVNPRGTWTVQLTISNQGPADTANLTLSDTLPEGSELISAAGSGWTCAPAQGMVSCTRASLAAGASSTVTIAVKMPAKPGPVTNQASVTSSVIDPDSDNNQSSASTTVAGVPVTGGNTMYIPLINTLP